jgi:hypothetical protein
MKNLLLIVLSLFSFSLFGQGVAYLKVNNAEVIESIRLPIEHIKGSNKYWKADLNGDGETGELGVRFVGSSLIISFKYLDYKGKNKQTSLFSEEVADNGVVELYLFDWKEDGEKELAIFFKDYQDGKDLLLLYRNFIDPKSEPKLVERWDGSPHNADKIQDVLDPERGTYWDYDMQGKKLEYAITWEAFYKNMINLSAIKTALPEGWYLLHDKGGYEIGPFDFNKDGVFDAVGLIENTKTEAVRIAILTKNDEGKYTLAFIGKDLMIDKKRNADLKNVIGVEHYSSLKFKFKDEDGLILLNYIAMGPPGNLNLISKEKTIEVNDNLNRIIDVDYFSTTAKANEVQESPYKTTELWSKTTQQKKPIPIKDLDTTLIFEDLSK